MALGLHTNFTLDMVPGGPPPIIHVSAGDVGRLFTANLLYNGEPYDIQGNVVKIRGTKPDRTVFEYPADDFERDDSWVDFIIEEQMAIVPGQVICELREYLNDDQIGSANFVLDVETAVYDPEAASESYIPSVESAIADAVESVNASAEDAEDSADRAEAAAESMAAYNTDRTPYLLRQSGGGVETGDREYDTIVGGTVAFNQLCNGSSVTVQNGHKYLSKTGSTWTVGASTGTAISNLTSGSDMVIDLTQMLGSTIADYIYSLEQATAGAGVAWFRSLFPKPYYEYNAGELLSVSGVSAHKMVGFNQWDEQWQNGFFNDSGVFTSRNDIVCTKNPIPVIPEESYYCKMDTTAFVTFWKSAVTPSNAPASEFISRSQIGSTRTITIPPNCKFVHFNFPATYGSTYKYDICINLFNQTKNGEYEPYKVNSYPLDDSLTLRGIPKLDGGKLYYDGDTYESDGTVTRKYGVRAYQSGDESLADAITDGTTTVYKLTTPTTETAEPFTNPQVVDPDGTEEYVTDSIVPVGHDTRYRVNLRDKLEPIFDVPTTDGTYTLTVTVSNGVATYSWTSS